jgi:predicted nuclease of predicted toxin-antitoxin system
MKFKMDQNFGKRTQQVFRMAGHDMQTVRVEGLQGSSDQSIYVHCCREQRCLVTLDLDFTDVTRFPPNQPQASRSFVSPRTQPYRCCNRQFTSFCTRSIQPL